MPTIYRPDYHSSAKRYSRWAPLLALGLFIGVFGAGLFNGWWSDLFAMASEGPADAGSGALPTPISVLEQPEVLESVNAGKATGRTREPAADFALPDLFDEQTIHTLSAYRGRPVILNFWASWCVPCRREMPALQATAAGYDADGLVLLGMNQTYIDDLARAQTFVEELGLTFANTRDDNGAVGAGAYQVAGIPTSVFINQEGEVVHIQIGEMSLEQITRYTDRLIAGQPLPP